MFKIATATIVAMTAVMADVSKDLAGNASQIQANNARSGANDAQVTKLNDAAKVFVSRDDKMKVHIAKDKASLQALSVKFYTAQHTYDNFAKELLRESKRLARAKALLTAERAMQKKLRDNLRKINDAIIKRVKFVKKTKHALAKRALKDNKTIRKARRAARHQAKKTAAVQKKALASAHGKSASKTSAVIKAAKKEAKKAQHDTRKAKRQIKKSVAKAHAIKKKLLKAAKKAKHAAHKAIRKAKKAGKK